MTSVCFWKGEASYFDVEVDGEVNQAATWYYPNPSEAANNIKNYVAFWKGVHVKKVAGSGEQQSEGIVQKIKG